MQNDQLIDWSWDESVCAYKLEIMRAVFTETDHNSNFHSLNISLKTSEYLVQNNQLSGPGMKLFVLNDI